MHIRVWKPRALVGTKQGWYARLTTEYLYCKMGGCFRKNFERFLTSLAVLPFLTKSNSSPTGVKFQTWQITSFATPATSLHTCLRGPSVVQGKGSKFVLQYLQSEMLFPQHLYNQWILPSHLYTQAAPYRDNSEVTMITREFFWDKCLITSLLSTWLTVMQLDVVINFQLNQPTSSSNSSSLLLVV
jgi:hypothetical protein